MTNLFKARREATRVERRRLIAGNNEQIVRRAQSPRPEGVARAAWHADAPPFEIAHLTSGRRDARALREQGRSVRDPERDAERSQKELFWIITV